MENLSCQQQQISYPFTRTNNHNPLHKLNYEKNQYKQKKAEFFGKTYTTKGHKPSNAKIKAITEMLILAFLKYLQTYLGMVQYLSKFSPRITELVE